MIELIQAPDTKRILADGNATPVKVRSTAGPDHYVRAKILVNDHLFLQKSWSKDESGVCTFNLQHLYYAYFENSFSPELTSGFHPKNNLIRRIRIEVEEMPVGGSEPIDIMILPEFFVIKNTRPVDFDDTVTVRMLDFQHKEMRAPRAGGIVFPLYARQGNLQMQILNHLGNPIHEETIQVESSGPGQFEMNFPDYPIGEEPYVFVRFATSQHEEMRRVNFIGPNYYHPTQVWYQNNFGFWCTAYLTGESREDHELTPSSYVQKDGTERTYYVGDRRDFAINSGSGYKEITNLIHSIATSTDVHLLLDGRWLPVTSETKKVQRFVDQKFIYSEALQFSRINLESHTNEASFAQFPSIGDITRTGDENEEIIISKTDLLASYAGAHQPDRLRVAVLPENGKLSYTTAAGTFNISDMVENDSDLMPFDIPLAELETLVYQPGYTLYGTPLDIVEYQVGAILWSNTGKIILNVNDVPDANLPPEIVVNSIQEVGLDSEGNATKVINAVTITDPEGDPVEILWEVLGSAPITIEDPTVEDPKITVTGGVGAQTYQLKVTATDTANNLSTSKTIDIKTSSYVLKISSARQPEHADSVIYLVRIFDGQPHETVLVRPILLAFDVQQYVVLNHGSNNESILYAGSSAPSSMITLNHNGEFNFDVKLVNPVSQPISLTMRLESASGSQIIDENNRETVMTL